MRTKIFLLFIAFFSFFLCSCSKDDDNGGDKVTKNKVVTITEYEWKFGEKSAYGELYAKYTYNELNKLVKKRPITTIL